MNTIEVTRRRVAIEGRVMDAVSGKAISGADVVLVEMPAPFKRWLGFYKLQFGTAWNAMAVRPDRTRSRKDGQFYFLDLPNGDYRVRASAPAMTPRYGQLYGTFEQRVMVGGEESIEYKLDDKHGRLTLALPPTAVAGSVTSKSGLVSFAQVRVQGSGETAFTDDAGNYRIAGIEPGQRTLLVSARGFQPISQVVKIAAPGTTETMNFELLGQDQSSHDKAVSRKSAIKAVKGKES